MGDEKPDQSPKRDRLIWQLKGIGMSVSNFPSPVPPWERKWSSRSSALPKFAMSPFGFGGFSAL